MKDGINLRKVYPTNEVSVRVENDAIYGGAHKYEMKNCVGFVDGETKYEGGTQEIQFVQKNDDGTIIPGLQSEQLLIMLIDRHTKLNNRFSSRSGALAITKMEEALHWLEDRVRERIERDVMGELKK